MGHAEVEFAAACIVRTCQVLGDTWQHISLEQCKATLKADFDAKTMPAYSWVTNPFFRLGIREMVSKGYADYDGDERLGLTQKAFEALAKVR